MPSVYHTPKGHGGARSRGSYSGVRTDDAEGMGAAKRFLEDWILPEHKDVLDGVLYTHSKFTGIKLVHMTHVDAFPWRKHYKPGVVGQVIPDGVIKDTTRA